MTFSIQAAAAASSRVSRETTRDVNSNSTTLWYSAGPEEKKNRHGAGIPERIWRDKWSVFGA